jgi:hypothetical protein
MKKYENCWEFKKCGREPGGKRVLEHGVCPASTDETKNLKNNGKNGGRICWMVSGTFCEYKCDALYADKDGTCLNCDFYQKIQKEHESKEFFSWIREVSERKNEVKSPDFTGF